MKFKTFAAQRLKRRKGGLPITPQEELNSFLVDVFHHILRAEARDIKSLGYRNLSISEMHVIEAAGQLEKEGLNSAREIAALLGITPGSLTAALGALEKKGYLLRLPDPKDRRRIRISLTDRGLKAEADHRLIHSRMVEQVAGRLEGEEEMRALLKALKSISAFFISERKDPS